MLVLKSYAKMYNVYITFVCVFVTVPLTDSCNETIIKTVPNLPLEQFGESKYYFGAIFQGSYFQAMQFCNYHDMRLLSIESKEENDFLWKNLKSFLGHGEYHFWTSGTSLSNAHWVWMSTGKPIIYANWSPNQPDNAANNEKCLEVRYSHVSKGLMWNDHICTFPKHLICETSLPKKISKLLFSVSNCNLTLFNVPAV